MKIFNRLSVAKKLAIAPVVLGAILVLITVAGIQAIDEVREDMHKITFDLAPDSALATDITENLYRLRITVKNYV